MGTQAALNNPLQPSSSVFTSGIQTTFNVAGTNFTSTNITWVQVTSSTTGISWALAPQPNGWNVVNATTLSLTATPTVISSPKDVSKLQGDTIGDLTVTINPNSTNQSTASKNNIVYKPG